MATVAARPPVPALRVLQRTRLDGPLSFIARLVRTRKGAIGATLVGLLLVAAVVGPVVAPHDPLDQDYEAVLAGPTISHPLGTDELGRDSLSRLLYGAQIAVVVGVMTVAIATAAGAMIGLVGAELGGAVDQVLMRIVDGVMAFPSLLLALGLLAILGPSLLNVILAVAIGNVPKFARLVRGEALSARSADYVVAARIMGASNGRIMLRHLWPNAVDALVVQASLTVGLAIVTEASLSFLGVGVQPPTPTWGWMLKSGYPFLQTAPLLPMVPGVAIFLTVLGCNLLGDAVRDALDPALKHAIAEV